MRNPLIILKNGKEVEETPIDRKAIEGGVKNMYTMP